MLLKRALFGLDPVPLQLYVDKGQQSAKFRDGLSKVNRAAIIEIAKRDDLHRFVVPPKRWIVEPTIAWLNHWRPLTKDWEGLNRAGRICVQWASVRLMPRTRCRSTI